MGTKAEIVWGYIARCTCGCGAVTAATVDRPEWEKENARTIAEWVVAGRHVERAQLPISMSRCKRQPSLLPESPV